MQSLLSLSESEKIIPLIPLRDGIIFPHSEVVLTFGRSRSINALESAFSSNKLIGVVMQKNGNLEDPKQEDLNNVGTLCQIERLLKGEGEINVLVKGLSRFEISSFVSTDPFYLVKIKELKEEFEKTDEIVALTNHLTAEFKKAVNIGKSVDFLVFMNIMSGLPYPELADQIASTLLLKPAEKQELLEQTKVIERFNKITTYLSHELKILEIERNIATKTQEKFDKNIRESVLRERIKTIEKELGESSEDQEHKELKEKIKKAQMPEEINKKAEKELRKLIQMTSYNPEASYIRTYLDWLVEIPWNIKSEGETNLKTARQVLDEDHYGLEKIKERIIEFLAVLKLRNGNIVLAKEEEEEKEKKKKNKETKIEKPRKANIPTILCFVGPPGVGKTSIGKSIARALGRKFIKISLGGIRDEAEIRGHRRTYVGAMPGRIIQGIKQAGTNNPVFMLDEIDKVGTDFRGDPTAALLEALDPEQNQAFSDHYLEVPFDLSEVMFITTANILDTVPPALKDRLEIISFSGYTTEEKFHIARDFLWKKQIEAHSLKIGKVKIADKALKEIIVKYTREAGVRNLERNIATICRKIAKKVAEGKKNLNIISLHSLPKHLGPIKFSPTIAEKNNETGIATGLAWTEAGGEILFIEVALMPGKGTLTITGQLGNVMKESCQAALSYVRTRWQELGIAEKFYQKIDIHIHVPEGAVPKDGPSAGAAIATAIVSALTKNPFRKEVAMTGEITLRGRILEIGGVKEKVIAARRAGIKIIILPKENKKDLEEIPKYVRKDLKFIFAEHMDEILKVAMVKEIKSK